MVSVAPPPVEPATVGSPLVAKAGEKTPLGLPLYGVERKRSERIAVFTGGVPSSRSRSLLARILVGESVGTGDGVGLGLAVGAGLGLAVGVGLGLAVGVGV